MANLVSYLPMGENSISRQWMEYQPSQNETIITLLAAGIISAGINYYSSNAYLISGTICYLALKGLEYEAKQSPPPSQQLVIGKPEKVSKQAVPLRIMSFIVLSSFIGKSLREARVKPTVIPEVSWGAYLLKAPFHYVSLKMVAKSVSNEFYEIGCKVPKLINEYPSEQERKILFIATGILSAVVSFSIPGMHLLSGYASLCTLSGLIITVISEKPGDESKILQALTCMKIMLVMSVGSYAGKISRYLIGPTNHSLPNTWLAFFYRLQYGIMNVTSVFLFLFIYLLSSNSREILSWISELSEEIKLAAAELIKMFEEMLDHCISIKNMTATELEADIEANPCPDIDLDIATEESLKAYFSYYFKSAVLMHADINGSERVNESYDFCELCVHGFIDFLNSLINQDAPEYDPQALSNEIVKEQPDSYRDNLRERIEKLPQVIRELGMMGQKEAAYLLLIDLSWEQEQMKKNGKVFALITHPDKDGGDAELFKSVQNAREVLKIT